MKYWEDLKHKQQQLTKHGWGELAASMLQYSVYQRWQSEQWRESRSKARKSAMVSPATRHTGHLEFTNQIPLHRVGPDPCNIKCACKYWMCMHVNIVEPVCFGDACEDSSLRLAQVDKSITNKRTRFRRFPLCKRFAHMRLRTDHTGHCQERSEWYVCKYYYGASVVVENAG